MAKRARVVAIVLRSAPDSQKSAALRTIAGLITERAAEIKAVNEVELKVARHNGLESALLDRLALSDRTLANMTDGLLQVAAMADPVGMIGPSTLRPNGMRVAQMRVPLGVVGIIYESRPNVTIDAAALCLKSGNAAILRGGSEALSCNRLLGEIISTGLAQAGLPTDAVQVVDTPDRDVVGALITLTEHIDVIIPRGGKSLITRLAKEARVPLIKHLEGNCHVYIDAAADQIMAHDIAVNAKTYRYGICGAMETLLVHQDLAAILLPRLAQTLTEHGVILRGCPRTRAIIQVAELATEIDWATEYLGPVLAIRVVENSAQAITHINRWSSGHTDAIVTNDLTQAMLFQRDVDSASVLINLPTCFADGFEYGLGTEIGISTNRLHARGPVGLEGLTTYKWVLNGAGQLRH